MSETTLAGSLVEMDLSATRAWYESATPWDCDCGYCRNFLALARRQRLPASVIDFLHALDIPAEKSTYVCMLYSEGDGFLYQFSYRIAGRILDPGDPVTLGNVRVHCWQEPYPYGAPGFPEPHFDLEFAVPLPWVLDESP